MDRVDKDFFSIKIRKIVKKNAVRQAEEELRREFNKDNEFSNSSLEPLDELIFFKVV